MNAKAHEVAFLTFYFRDKWPVRSMSEHGQSTSLSSQIVNMIIVNATDPFLPAVFPLTTYSSGHSERMARFLLFCAM